MTGGRWHVTVSFPLPRGRAGDAIRWALLEGRLFDLLRLDEVRTWWSRW